MNADLNSERNRAVIGFFCNKAAVAISRIFPTRAAACYSGLIIGFSLAFVPITKNAPVKLTLATTLIGAGMVAIAAHELDELQDDIDELREQRERDRKLRLFTDAEAKNKLAETNLLRHNYELEKSLPAEIQEAIAPGKSQPSEPTSEMSRAAFNAAVDAVQGKTKPKSEAPEPVVIAQKLSFAETMTQIAQRMVSITLIGVPGAGKGIFVSNLLRLVKRFHPQLHVFVMEGKGDTKEANYWSNADDVRSIKGLEESPVDVVAWINGSLEDFKAIKGPKLLIFDEVTYLYKVWQRTEKEGFEQYVEYKTGLSSMGDSLQNYIWEVGQVSNAKDLGVSGGIRSLFKPIAIVSNHDRRAANALLGTKFVPLPDDGKKAVLGMCDRSTCGRAVYDYVNDCWQAMPELENLSGFNRDTRSFVSQPVPEKAKQPDVRANLERLLSVEPEPHRESTQFGLTKAQIDEVQRRLSGLQTGSISSVKRIRENSRLLREQGIKQADLSELFDYLAQTQAITWLANDKRDFQYLGGL